MSISNLEENEIAPDQGFVPMYGGFNFADYLRETLAQATTLRKSEKTRGSLEISAAELLEQDGFHSLKVADIVARSGCAHGTFYRYWNDSTGITYDVISHFMDVIRTRRPKPIRTTGLFDRLLSGHLYYVEVYKMNPGLMRCHMQLGDQIPEFRELGDRTNLQLARRVVRAFEAEMQADELKDGENQRLLIAMSCIGAVDNLLRDLYLHNVDLGLTLEEIAHSLSLIWYRSFCARDPKPVS